LRKIKLLVVALLAFIIGVSYVSALDPHPENGALIVDDVILYNHSRKTNNNVEGVLFDENAMALIISSDFESTSGKGIEVIEMGDHFDIYVDGAVSFEVKNENDGIYILNSDVTLKYKENSFLTIKSDKGAGIFSTGTSNLTIENISLNTNVIKYDQGTVKVWDNSQISSNAKFYKGDDEVSLDTLYVTPELQEDVVIPDKKSSYELKRRDSFSDIIVFVLIAGVLVAGAIIVLLVTIKNQKRK